MIGVDPVGPPSTWTVLEPKRPWGHDGKALRAAPLVGWWQSGKNTGSWRQIRAMGEVEQKPPNRKLPPNPRITRSGAPEAIGVCVGTLLGLLLFEYTAKKMETA